MTNEHYLIVSYFLFGLVSLLLGVSAYCVLRRSFAVIAEAVAGLRVAMLRRTLALSLALAAVLGFLSVSYRGCGMSYEEILKERSYLVQKNQEQLQGAGNWIAGTVLVWGVVVVIGLVAVRRKEESSARQRDGR
jgi:hypothetical protein